MKKTLLAIAAAVALSACAAVHPGTPVSATARGSVTGFATLAVWGTWEMELAPAYTRLAVLLHQAARQSEAERISVATSVEIQALGNMARRNLDASRRGEQTAPTQTQRAALAEAIQIIERAEALLEK